MRPKKILFCTEAHFLPTGYSVYTKEVLSRLNRDPRFDVMELATYVDQATVDQQNPEWKVVANQPSKGTPEWDKYKSRVTYEFGEFKLNDVLLEFMPDFVMDIRDWWMMEFVQRSTFREFFDWCIMPTVDAFPQNQQWIDTFCSAEAVFSYSEFGRDVLINQAPAINFVDVASPCASHHFSPAVDKVLHKRKYGLPDDAFVIGTVMRNQRRKLYPDLFDVFRRFLDATGAKNAYLHCHTAYPDLGWEFPDLLQKYGIANRVLFTYRCKKCGAISSKIFSDVISHCDNCHSMESQMAGINNQVSELELSEIYKLFDLYIQYANSEGFGMPQLEALSSGVPLMTVDYSAMQSVADNTGAIKIPVMKLSPECETGCYRAIPDNDATFLEMMKMYALSREDLSSLGSSMRDKAISNYNWDKTANVWANHFANTPVKDIRSTWLSQPTIKAPAPKTLVPTSSVKDQADFLFSDVLCMPHLIGGYQWKRLLKDLTYKCTARSTSVDFYFNESHTNNGSMTMEQFNIDKAYDAMSQARSIHNMWEEARAQVIQRGGVS